MSSVLLQYTSLGNDYLSYYSPHNAYHPGVDLNWGSTPTADLGKTVPAPIRGVVEYISPPGKNGGLGLYLVIRHDEQNRWSRFLHLQKTEKGLAKGQVVEKDQIVAYVGDSGTESPHLHWELLNAHGLAFIRDFWRPYGRYYSGLSKGEVAAMTENPLTWLRELEAHPNWKDDVQKWATQMGFIASGWDRRDEPMSQVRAAAALHKMYGALKAEIDALKAK